MSRNDIIFKLLASIRNVNEKCYFSISIPIITCTANKQKWVPLEIDLAQNRGTMRSPRFQNHRERNGEGNICTYNIIFVYVCMLKLQYAHIVIIETNEYKL